VCANVFGFVFVRGIDTFTTGIYPAISPVLYGQFDTSQEQFPRGGERRRRRTGDKHPPLISGLSSPTQSPRARFFLPFTPPRPDFNSLAPVAFWVPSTTGMMLVVIDLCVVVQVSCFEDRDPAIDLFQLAVGTLIALLTRMQSVRSIRRWYLGRRGRNATRRS
jgi:hypothetical protein